MRFTDDDRRLGVTIGGGLAASEDGAFGLDDDQVRVVLGGCEPAVPVGGDRVIAGRGREPLAGEGPQRGPLPRAFRADEEVGVNRAVDRRSQAGHRIVLARHRVPTR